jgi:hypothetical protein
MAGFMRDAQASAISRTGRIIDQEKFLTMTVEKDRSRKKELAKIGVCDFWGSVHSRGSA